MQPPLRRITVCVATPIVLVALMALELSMGANALPNWLSNASVKVGASPEGAVRALLVLEFVALAVLLIFRRAATTVAWFTFTALAFAGLADLSAVFAGPAKGAIPTHFWAVPLGLLLVGAGGLAALTMTADAATAARATAPEGAKGAPLKAGHVLLLVVVAGVAMAVAPRLPIAERASQLLEGIETVILDPSSWEGRTVPATGVPRYLPQLTPLTMEGTKWIVFYQPSCGRCHEVFDAYFAKDNVMEVIAVQVPHAPDEKPLASDQRADINCQNCTRLSLPSGYKWIGLTTPTIVKVENGKVTCVTWTDYDRCRKASDTVE